MAKLERKKKRQKKVQLVALKKSIELLETTQKELNLLQEFDTSVFNNFEKLGLALQHHDQFQTLKETRDVLQEKLDKTHARFVQDQNELLNRISSERLVDEVFEGKSSVKIAQKVQAAETESEQEESKQEVQNEFSFNGKIQAKE